MNKHLRKELESLRELEHRRQMVMLARNTPLQKLVCVWPMIEVMEMQFKKGETAPGPDYPISTKLRWLWRFFEVEMSHLQLAVGIGPDVHDLFNQAKYSLLIWPDGTINQHAARYLHKSAEHAVAIPNNGPVWADPMQHDDDDD